MTVDILFPYYGDVAMMKQAVLSVVGQTNPDWRMIVVDDGYPDDSIPGWFESLKDERITYMRNEKNLGANGNYRKCLTFVENDLVTVMGADDVMLPNYVQWLVDSAAKHPEASIFQPGVVVIDENNYCRIPWWSRLRRSTVPRVRLFCRVRSWLPPCCAARGSTSRPWVGVKTLSWAPASVSLNVVQDMALILDITMRGGSLYYDPQVAFMYRRHGGSDSSWRALEGTRFDEERRYMNTIADEMTALGWTKAARVPYPFLLACSRADSAAEGAWRRSGRVLRTLPSMW